MKPTIITISGQAQHGKDSSRDIMIDLLESKGKKCLKINYADYLKYIAKQYFGWDGQKDEAGRTLLQWLGTEKVRTVDPAFWFYTVVRLVEVIGDEYDYVIISDARFPNEVSGWLDEDYKVISIRVYRPGFDNGLTMAQKNHPSERALDGFKFDYRLTAMNLLELTEEVTKMVEQARL